MKSVYLTSALALGFAAAGCGPGLNHPQQSPEAPPPSEPAPTPNGGIPAPTFDEPTVVADTPPPPISGGTLTVIAHGTQAAVADPDRDQVLLVDLTTLAVTTIALQPGDEPGRLIEDAAGRVHVSLRGGGGVATIDPSAGTVVARRAVCAYPRGLAYDVRTDVIQVACAGGELVTLPATGGDATRTLHLDRDLRDVIIDGDHLLVSRFRAAQLLVVESDGSVSARLTPPGFEQPISPGASNGPTQFTPGVAWRTIANPDGGAFMVFEQEQTSEVVIQPGGYGGSGCGSIVQTGIALMRADGSGWTAIDSGSVLPVDLALAPGGSRISVARAGVTQRSDPTLATHVLDFTVPQVPTDPSNNGCNGAIAASGGASGGMPGMQAPAPVGQAVAVAYDGTGQLLVQTREPSALIVGDRTVTLPGQSRTDTGHLLFHLGTSGGIACASCHPEGREDGHVWTFAELGQRRTQAIGGGIQGTEPFHWSGDMTDFGMLSHEVLTNRMSGPELTADQATVLSNWINKIPAWKPTVAADPPAAERGRLLFNDANVGCATCHSGEKLTNNATVLVGTGAPFQVPSLRGVGYRAPYMHQGCAKTLDDRFGSCGGGDQHGKTSLLTGPERADLVAFLGTL